MPAAHRHGDPRDCGATTIVSGQGSTAVDGALWAVQGDQNTHIGGELIPTGSTVYIEGKLVIVHTPDHAQVDRLGHPDPETAGGSGKTFAYG